MTRPIILGNGNMLVCLDKNACIRDFYYPYVGQENHVSGNHHRIGIYADGKFSWIYDGHWNLLLKYKKDTLVSEVIAHNNELVHCQKNILLRRVQVKNLWEGKREIKLFFAQHFNISEDNIGDTVYYNPLFESIINFKGKRYFLIGGMYENKSFTDYATGNSGVQGKEGTWKDAEDGFLSKNAIEHGSVDSTIGFTLFLDKNQSKPVDYWITVGEKHQNVCELRDIVVREGIIKLMNETEEHWKKWVHKKEVNFYHLGESIQDLFFRSLLIIRAQTDNHGAIIAANDTHTFHFKKDTYSYMWPRDGALVARSLDKMGHQDITAMFFQFCVGLISEGNYLLPKYRPDGSVGSSWHPWLKGDKLQLPIQEDETGLILDALWKHYLQHKNPVLIKKMYKSFIQPAGDFLLDFRDVETKLPKESYDLWEEKLGVHTFTCSTVYAGLLGAKNFADLFGRKTNANKYFIAAQEVREEIINYLYDKEGQIFLKGICYDDNGVIKKDKTLDISTVYGLFEYGILNIDDPRLIRTMDKTIARLWGNSGCKGMARHEWDNYYSLSKDAPENIWFISTMWLSGDFISRAKTVDDFKPAEELFFLGNDRGLSSGGLSEQLNPYNGEPLSVAPLTWSHAGFIIAVVKYIEKFERLNNLENSNNNSGKD